MAKTVGLGAAVLGGCSSEPVSGVDWEGVEAQWSGSFLTSRPRHELWVFVVDDAPTERARALRADLAAELPGYWDDRRRRACAGGWDFAQYWPRQLHMLIIPSSNPSAALHEGVLPELFLDTENVRSATAGDWETALAAAIVDLESEQAEPNGVLAALHHWGELLAAIRAPSSAAEASFLAALPAERSTMIFTYSTRDDESPLAPEEYELTPFKALGSEAVLDGECQREEILVPRLTEVFSVRCAPPPYLPSSFACETAAVCERRLPARLDSGLAACRATINVKDLAACPSEAGWLDPLDADGVRRPRWTVNPERWPEGRYRVCEIRQLERAARTACESDFDCVGCEPGFCFREDFLGHPDFPVDYCADRGRWSKGRFRFVHGSGSVATGHGTMVCDLETTGETP